MLRLTSQKVEDGVEKVSPGQGTRQKLTVVTHRECDNGLK